MALYTKTIPPKYVGVGQIESYQITDAGIGYLSAPTVSFNAPFATETATATCTIDASGQVNAVTITTAGSGYGYATYAPYTATVTFSAAPTGGGVDATGIAVISATGQITDILLTNIGSGYTVAPTITIAAPISGLPVATTTIDASGQVTALVFTDFGFGYTDTNPPVATISAAPSGGTTATATLGIKEIMNLDGRWHNNVASAGQSISFVDAAQAVLNDATGIANEPGWWMLRGYVDSAGNYRCKQELLASLSS